MRNPALFSRIFNTPLMIQPSKLDAILAGIGGRFDMEIPQQDAALTAKGEHKQPGYQVINGVAVIGVIGVLAHRGGFDANSSYILGYDRISQMFQAAIGDPAVKSILLEIDSPGGEVAGAFELAAMIREGGKVKPVNAVISSTAASAGYLLASAANDIAIAETGIAGSIGVFLRHADISKAAENEGLKVTYVFAGGHKVDGNPYQPLPDAVRKDLQAQIDKTYGLFVNTVADYRGLTPAAVKGQEARIYTGSDAITAGLADRIATPDQILNEMQQGVFKSAKPNLAIAAEQEKLESAAGWEKAVASANNPPPVGIADITISGRGAEPGHPAYQGSHTQTMPAQGQTEAAAGWERAVEKANAQLKASHRDTAQSHQESPNMSIASQNQDEVAVGWEKAVEKANALSRGN
jgi:capsid assembly protease